jgi:hypothetical protein
VNIKLAVLAWVVAVGPAQAAPIALMQKLGVTRTSFPIAAPCYLRASAGSRRTIADEMDQPLGSPQQESARCIVTAVSAAGYFAAFEEASFADSDGVRLEAAGPALFCGGLLILVGWTHRRLRVQPHRHPVVRKRLRTIRQMAPLS